jgi:hypothetical protein
VIGGSRRYGFSWRLRTGETAVSARCSSCSASHATAVSDSDSSLRALSVAPLLFERCRESASKAANSYLLVIRIFTAFSSEPLRVFGIKFFG